MRVCSRANASPLCMLRVTVEIVGKVACLNPFYDFVPPELVNLFISDIGGSSPSFVYRYLADYYHEDDYDL